MSASFCDRCGETEGVEETTIGADRYWLCPGCRAGIIETARSLIDDYDPEASTLYVQLERRQVDRIRGQVRDGCVANIITLTPDQAEYIMQKVSELDDWGLGLVDEQGEVYHDE